MAQDDLTVVNGSGATVRAKINSALAALASMQKGSGAPSSPVAGMLWIEDDNPSSTVWTVWQYDGADWIKFGQIDTTNNRFMAARTMGLRDLVTFSSTATATAAQVGFAFIFGGSSDAILNLPQASTLADGAMYSIRNAGNNDAILTIDPYSTEQINGASTLLLLAGESIDVVLSGGAWFVFGLPSGFRQIRRKTLSGAAASVELKLPADFKRFRLVVSNTSVSSGGSGLIMRMSVNGGTIFLSAGSDYDGAILDTTSSGITAGSTGSIGYVGLTPALSATFKTDGFVEWEGRAVAGGQIMMSGVQNSPTQWFLRTGSFYCNNATRPTDIQILTTSGNIATGTFTVEGLL